MKKIITLALCIFFVILTPLKTEGMNDTDNSMLQEQMDILDFSDVSDVISKSQNSEIRKIEIKDLVMQAIKGEIDLSPKNILNMITSSFFSEVNSLISLMKHMIAIAILSAFFKAFSSSFKSNSVAELGFYVNYIVIITVLLSSFSICVGIMQELTNELCDLMLAAQPLLLSLVVMSGNIASSYVFSPVMLFFITFLANFLQMFITPTILMAAVLQIVNYISEREMLQKFSDLIRIIVSWGLKMIAIIFISILSLQRITTPILNNAITKSAKVAVNFVPVVGQALTGAVDAVLYWSGAVRGGVMAAVIILIIIMCGAPILKIIAFVFVYKMTAGIVQPICDERIVKAIDSAGTFAALILGVCVVISVMFIFMIMIVLSF